MEPGNTVVEPDVPFDPDHAAPAVQPVASVEDQVSTLGPPGPTSVGFAEMLTDGAGTIVTVVEADPAPTALLHSSVYVEVTDGDTFAEPVRLLVPDHDPLAAHELALVDDHVNVLVAPAAMLLGLALRLTVGSGTTVTAADPDTAVPMPFTHDMPYIELAVGCTTSEPEIGLAPDHEPLAVHDEVLVDTQVSVLAPAGATFVGFAEMLRVGVGRTVTVTEPLPLTPRAFRQVNV